MQKKALRILSNRSKRGLLAFKPLRLANLDLLKFRCSKGFGINYPLLIKLRYTMRYFVPGIVKDLPPATVTFINFDRLYVLVISYFFLATFIFDSPYTRHKPFLYVFFFLPGLAENNVCTKPFTGARFFRAH